jgi:transcription antitermination factor NusG
MPSPLDQPEQPTPAEQNDNEVQDQTAIDQPPQPLAIEYGEATQTAADASTSDETVQKLDLGQGDVVKLDALGPMIINTDGVSDITWMFVRSTDGVTDIIAHSKLARAYRIRTRTYGTGIGEKEERSQAAETEG